MSRLDAIVLECDTGDPDLYECSLRELADANPHLVDVARWVLREAHQGEARTFVVPRRAAPLTVRVLIKAHDDDITSPSRRLPLHHGTTADSGCDACGGRGWIYVDHHFAGVVVEETAGVVVEETGERHPDTVETEREPCACVRDLVMA